MFYKTILKNRLFVIFAVMLTATGISCDLSSLHGKPGGVKNRENLSPYFADAVVTGHLNTSEIKESSGLVNSRCNPDVLWTHNDSGGKNLIFALSLKGNVLGKWSVTGARNVDWEDIAGFRDKNGECFLFIADIGNNSRMRESQTIYKIKEPDVTAVKTGKTDETERAEMISFSYPDMRHDAEGIAVHPVSGEIYIITKRATGAAGVYKLKSGVKTAVKVADIDLPSMPNGLVTGADISPDGRHVIVCDYFAGFEFALADGASDFDEIWKSKPRMVDLGTREQGEAVTYSADGMAVYASSERANSPIIMTKRKRND